MKNTFAASLALLVSPLMATLISTTAHGGTYVCDVDGALAKLTDADFKPKAAKLYKANYDAVFNQQENAIQALAKKNKLSDDVARTRYFKTKQGQTTASFLQSIRTAFAYDAVDRYLFDDGEWNKSVSYFTRITRVGDHMYYLDGNRVIAVATRTGNKIMLRRYNDVCGVSQIVNFPSNDAAQDLLANFIVNKDFCDRTDQGRVAKISEETTQATGAEVYPPQDATELKVWRSDLSTACHSFSGAVSGPKAKATGSQSAVQ